MLLGVSGRQINSLGVIDLVVQIVSLPLLYMFFFFFNPGLVHEICRLNVLVFYTLNQVFFFSFKATHIYGERNYCADLFASLLYPNTFGKNGGVINCLGADLSWDALLNLDASFLKKKSIKESKGQNIQLSKK